MAASTLWERWNERAMGAPDSDAIVHWVAGEAPYRFSWEVLLAAASAIAVRLLAAGVKKGEVCALIIRHQRDFYPTYLGVSATGALPAVLAYPNPRLHPDKFRQGLEGMAQHSGLDWLLTERDLEPVLAPLVGSPGSTIRGTLFPLEWATAGEAGGGGMAPVRLASSEPCLIQHSSGTTGLQKAVLLSHRTVLDHVDAYARAIALDPADKVISWLPLYHDMGLIAALHLPLARGVPLVQLDPFEWVMAPEILLQAVSAEGGTLVWLPNFAYNLMADRCRDDELAGVRLDSVRMLVNCSEPVRADSHERFARRFAARGFRRSALSACYAMAETTFAVTQTRPGTEAARLVVDRAALAAGEVRLGGDGAAARNCVSSGVPIEGCTLKVVAETGEELGDDRVGELLIASRYAFEGYRNSPEKTAEVLHSGWFTSGDYGFRHAGEYYVIGRKKDLIIVAGKNLYPEDIEDAAGQVPGVLPGRVVAFGVEDEATGTEQVWLVVETERDLAADGAALRTAIVAAAMRIDVTLARVHLVPPRWLIKSSSGKPSRKANKERVLEQRSSRETNR